MTIRSVADVGIKATSSPYFFKNGFRCVFPYHFSFKSNAKGRWFGKTLLKAFTDEFPFISQSYWEGKAAIGAVNINGKSENCLNTIIGMHDVIEHSYHYHEKPVSDGSISVVFENDDMFAVHKPSSIPIHPCGQYNYNSLVKILQVENGKEHVLPMHRIDRLTSGIVLFAKNEKFAKNIFEEMFRSKVKKEYIARVDGEFPESEMDVNEPLIMANSPRGWTTIGLGGKPSRTIFSRISYDANTNTSVVRCVPITGRTHQIRAHLKHIGFPIANDPLYNESFAVRTRGHLSMLQTLYEPRESDRIHISNEDHTHIDKECDRCEKEYIYPTKEEMWLHARKYQHDSFLVEIDYPRWANYK